MKVAEKILEQLGGQKFIAMTGANHFVDIPVLDDFIDFIFHSEIFRFCVLRDPVQLRQLFSRRGISLFHNTFP